LKYFRPEILSGLGKASLKSRQVVEGVLSGLHDSTFRGYSVEFAEHRKYSHGDDIRHIDWKAYGKSDRYLIKEYEEETDLKGLIIIDASASMDYGSGESTKWEYACYLAASLSYLLLRQRDAVGMVVFNDEVRAALPPMMRLSYLKHIDNALSRSRPQGRVSSANLMSTVRGMAPRRGLVILISDLLDQCEEIITSIKQLKHRKNEIIVFQVLDKEELDFPFTGLTIFEDMEQDTRVMADPLAIRKEYRRRMNAFLEHCSHLCRSALLEHRLLNTSTPPGLALSKYLSTRGVARKRN